MSGNIEIKIKIPPDENGMVGRECPECHSYFKIKFGTGLETSICNCPYCELSGASDKFCTKNQIEYAKSIAINQLINDFVKPSLENLTNQFKDLERKTRNSLIKIKVKTKIPDLTVPVKYYTENELETTLVCDNCGLEFSIFSVFACCPDCKQLNAFVIYEKSIEVTKKQFCIVMKDSIPNEIKELSFKSALTNCISLFDGLGKELRTRKPHLYPSKPKNLFQNIKLLNEKLNNEISNKHSDFNTLLKLFQVRHLFEHNMGVIDNDFLKFFPEYSKKINHKYKLTETELSNFILLMDELGLIIKSHFQKDE
jgi:hypothetical protein